MQLPSKNPKYIKEEQIFGNLYSWEYTRQGKKEYKKFLDACNAWLEWVMTPCN